MKRIYNTLLAVTALLAFAPAVYAQTPGQWSINGQIHETVVDPDTGVETIKYLEWPKASENGLQQNPGTDFAYSKDISSPQSNGQYWIKLESFSTGAATRILSSTPSDIILILDSSSSMNTQDYGGTVTYTSRGVQSYSYQSYGNNTYYYLHSDGKYYPVSRGGNGNGVVRYLTFTADDGTVYYLNNWARGNSNNNIQFSGDGLLTSPPTTNPTSNNLYCWRGTLYNRTVTGAVTRISALRTATKEFIDNIYDNDTEVTAVDQSFAGNRIAIVTYDNSAHLLTTGWVDVGATGAVTTLKNAVDGITLNNWTRPALGMSSAITNFLQGSDADHTQRAGANLTVVMFTDGVPAHSQGTGNTFENIDANDAIYYGYELKHDYEATLYTVGLLNLNSTDENIKKGIHFLDLLSSNYPNSYIALNSTNSAWTVSGNTVSVDNLTGGSASDKDPEGDYFQLVDEDTDLSAIFQSISKQSGGSASQLSASSRNVDVVSNSFILPEGTTAENIGSVVKIFIAKVSGYDSATQKYTFYEEILKGHTPDSPEDPITGYYYYPLDEDGNIAQPAELVKVDADIAIAYNASAQAVTVTGFDYGSNFCGPVYEQNYVPSDPPTAADLEHVDHYQGFKIIIMIPIEMNPNAVGGPDVQTNGPGSGIYVSSEGGDALVSFKSPTVSLPVNIHLKKTGLGAGESAKFKIERAIIPELAEGETLDPTTLSDWSYVSTVFVTKPQGSTSATPDPVVKVRGLPANMDVEEGGETVHRSFVYRITEEGWSWSYDSQTPPQYTSTSNVENPFTFDNQKKENIDVKVRHAESKATNIFKPGIETNNVKYDDSKDNGR